MRNYLRKKAMGFGVVASLCFTVIFSYLFNWLHIELNFVVLMLILILNLCLFLLTPALFAKVEQDAKDRAEAAAQEKAKIDAEAAAAKAAMPIPYVHDHTTERNRRNLRELADEWERDHVVYVDEDDNEIKDYDPKDYKSPEKCTDGVRDDNGDFRVDTNITFADIAGYTQTKDSLQFIVSCMTDHERLQKIGATIPRGILLYGPPGTGKTLLAKAIAGTAGVPMFAVSASQFVEIYVGNGAKNVRALYETAKKNAPCIVFIDEIDAVGGTRQGTTNDERRQTLNALLVEINGITSDDKIITIAATNDMESLDPALLRPGRFDRKVMIPLPDMEDRKKILKLYLKKKSVSSDVDIEAIAMTTEGFSGASLSSLVNEAAINAVYNHRESIEKKDIDDAFFQVMTGGEKKQVTNKEDLAVIAYHEAGHALALKLLTNDVVPTVTIIGSTSGAGGYTFRHSAKESCLFSKKTLKAQIEILFAGRAGEECFFGNKFDITNGSSDDLKKASELIREYLTTYGMGEQSLLNVDAFIGQMDSATVNEAKEMADALYQEVLTLLEDNRESLEKIATALLEKNTLTDADLNSLVEKGA